METKIGLALVAVLMATSANAYELGSAAPKAPLKAQASNILGGEEGDACQIMLCLSDPSGKGLAECQQPLKKWENTKPKKRPGLLRKCPLVGGGGGDS
ncbi:MAG: hypothetical protein H5U32_03345 [Pseudomonas balearica]|jgi:hypothetical protein|uniref:hypothetical protein n=1 Tax=Stutzerimonas balearica TaxID=74829 RepID=UPI0019B0D277|nr:hypothetical protein [Stutzerimonas balearica]MBC7198264.1 hypothetical protein [Stutzerimonas balearica]